MDIIKYKGDFIYVTKSQGWYVLKYKYIVMRYMYYTKKEALKRFKEEIKLKEA